MKANALPIQLNNAPVNVEPACAAVPAAADSATDFVAMLMQLLGGNAPAATVPPPATTKLPTSESTDSDSEDASALAAMLAMPVPVPQPWAALPSAGSTESADPLEMLGLNAPAAKESAAALLMLKTELAATLSEPAANTDTKSNDGIGSLSPFAEALQTRSNHAEVPAARPLHTPVGTAQWADELGTRLTWMVDRGQQAASLRLSPEHLGPLEVRISITDDKASVWFGAAHVDTRAAIEHALPRLREMFSAQGLSLADAGVFREPPRDQPTPVPRSFAADTDAGQREGDVMISTRGIGLVDAYA